MLFIVAIDVATIANGLVVFHCIDTLHGDIYLTDTANVFMGSRGHGQETKR